MPEINLTEAEIAAVAGTQKIFQMHLTFIKNQGTGADNVDAMKIAAQLTVATETKILGNDLWVALEQLSITD